MFKENENSKKIPHAKNVGPKDVPFETNVEQRSVTYESNGAPINTPYESNISPRNMPFETNEIRQDNVGFRSFRRISWGAVLAGMAIALVVQMILSLLGLGLGLGAINVTETNPTEGLGIGALIWWVASMLVSLFCGGLVAGRLAGLVGKADSLIHGILTWCMFTLLSFFLVTTTVGGVFNTVGRAISQGATMVGKGEITEKAPEIKQEIEERIENLDKQQAGEASKTASIVGIFGAIGLTLGGVVAALGGLAGRPKPVVSTETTRNPGQERDYIYRR